MPGLAKTIYCPPGWNTQAAALRDLIRFGPGLLGAPGFVVLLYYVERTILWGKLRDRTSSSQMIRGVHSSSSTAHWHRGAIGLCKSHSMYVTKALIEIGLIYKFPRKKIGTESPAVSAVEVNWEEWK